MNDANNPSFPFQGYDEIFKFLNLLGTVFGWVASDVALKLNILRDHRAGAESGAQYATLQSMVAHEVALKWTEPKAKEVTGSGSRNLLKLHRALEYITDFLQQLPGEDLTIV